MINTGATAINYTNLIILGLVIISGFALSANDAAQKRESIATGISDISEAIQHHGGTSIASHPAATFDTVNNSISVVKSVELIGVIILIMCIAFAMFFMRGMA